jgi:dTDP-4-dehydrorhamnose 3,5-epimerase-like enzyme
MALQVPTELQKKNSLRELQRLLSWLISVTVVQRQKLKSCWCLVLRANHTQEQQKHNNLMYVKKGRAHYLLSSVSIEILNTFVSTWTILVMMQSLLYLSFTKGQMGQIYQNGEDYIGYYPYSTNKS